MAPSYAGPGRWVIVDTDTRKSHLAMGPDVVPPSISLLSDCCTGKTPAALLDNNIAHASITPVQLNSLCQRGLLSTTPIDDTRSLTDLYHRYVFDYPFNDYAAADWRERDLELMQQYARVSAPPPPQSSFSGAFNVRLREFPSLQSDADGCARGVAAAGELDRLAFVLKFTFGATGVVRSRFLDCIRRTSPSGGARHPTDAFVEVGSSSAELESGLYAYDATTHALIWLDHCRTPTASASRFVLSIRSTVERAMWRYRDERAYRPVLIDIGHIVETLRVVSTAVGLNLSPDRSGGQLQSQRCFSHPEFIRLSVCQLGSDAGPSEPRRAFNSHAVTHEAPTYYLTNPLMYVVPTSRGLVAHTTWPDSVSCEVTPSDFKVLNHCTPSQRGDRDQSIKGTVEATNVPEQRVEELVKRSVLLPRELAELGYSGARHWSRYGWYLSLLKYSNSRNGSSSTELWSPASRHDAPNLSVNLDLILQRRTCRRFAPAEISVDALNNLVTAVSDNLNCSVFVASLRVTGLIPGAIYEVDDGELRYTGRVVTAQEIAAATIGQAPSSSGALTFWLIANADLVDNNPRYEHAMIRLGMLGHRICLACCQIGLGVFMTPALSEQNTHKLLGLRSACVSAVPYLLSVGVPHD